MDKNRNLGAALRPFHTDKLATPLRRFFGVAVTGALASLLIVSSAQASGTWGTAEETPGFSSLSTGASALVYEISCSSAGDCSSIGSYTDAASNVQAFVDTETKGQWAAAVPIAGLSILNFGGQVGNVLDISCSSPGNCGAGGTYTDAAKHTQAFVANETNGTWGSAIEIPGYGALNAGGTDGELFSLSCSSAGNCSAGGTYTDATSNDQAFVANETNGTWASAIEVPGTSTLNAGGGAQVLSLDCTAVGECDAVGDYTDASKHLQVFTDSETSGTWNTAVALPGLAALNVGGASQPFQISCASPGSCSAGGTYTDATGNNQAFVADETNGTWASAIEIPGTSTLNVGGSAYLFGVSCASAGNCSAAGSYADGSKYTQAFVANETNGTWGTAIEIPGTSTLNVGGNAEVNEISCSDVGYCSAGGFYTDSLGNGQGFVVNEVGGTWASATNVTGLSALNVGDDAAVFAVSCSRDGSCSAGGLYSDTATTEQGFYVSASADIFAPKAPSIRAVSSANGALTVTVTRATANGGSPIVGYQYSLNGGAWMKVSTGISGTVHLAHLVAGRTYRVKLRAINRIGTGAASAVKSVRVK